MDNVRNPFSHVALWITLSLWITRRVMWITWPVIHRRFARKRLSTFGAKLSTSYPQRNVESSTGYPQALPTFVNNYVDNFFNFYRLRRSVAAGRIVLTNRNPNDMWITAKHAKTVSQNDSERRQVHVLRQVSWIPASIEP